jgi:hypothetical protein
VEAHEGQRCQRNRGGRSCGGVLEFVRYCGAWVCGTCDAHRGLARCYCGWSAHGGDGYRELVEMGETIEEDY